MSLPFVNGLRLTDVEPVFGIGAGALVVSNVYPVGSKSAGGKKGAFVDVYDAETGKLCRDVPVGDLLPEWDGGARKNYEVDCLLVRVKQRLAGATVAETLRNCFRAYASRPMVSDRAEELETDGSQLQQRWISWASIGARAEALARGLRHAVKEKNERELVFVAIRAQNSVASLVALFATLLAGNMVLVPIHATARAEYARHILREGRVSVLFSDGGRDSPAGPGGLRELLGEAAPESLELVIDMADGGQGEGEPPPFGSTLSLAYVEQRGRELLEEEAARWRNLCLVKEGLLRRLFAFSAAGSKVEVWRKGAWKAAVVGEDADASPSDGISVDGVSSAAVSIKLEEERGKTLRLAAPLLTGELVVSALRGADAGERDRGFREAVERTQRELLPTAPDDELLSLLVSAVAQDVPDGWERVEQKLAALTRLAEAWGAARAAGFSSSKTSLQKTRAALVRLHYSGLDSEDPADSAPAAVTRAIGRLCELLGGFEEAAPQHMLRLESVLDVASSTMERPWLALALSLAAPLAAISEAAMQLCLRIAEKTQDYRDQDQFYQLADRVQIPGVERGRLCSVIVKGGVGIWRTEAGEQGGGGALFRTATEVRAHHAAAGTPKTLLPCGTVVTVSGVGVVESSTAGERRALVSVRSELFGEGWIPLYAEEEGEGGDQAREADEPFQGQRTLAPVDSTSSLHRARSQPALILYTSGSTGAPKGAILLDRDLRDTITEYVRFYDKLEAKQKNSTEIPYSDYSAVLVTQAPLSTSGSIFGVLRTLVSGGRTFILKDSARWMEVLPNVGVTTKSAVPQVWMAVYKRFYAREVEEVWRRHRVSGKEVDRPTSGVSGEHVDSRKADLPGEEDAPLLQDRDSRLTPKGQQLLETIRSEVRALFGNRLSSINVGGALPNKRVMSWLRLILSRAGVAVTENYGLTEAGGVGNAQEGGNGIITIKTGRARSGDVKAGEEVVQVKLRDYEDIYTSEDKPYPRGEIMVKTRRMAAGYLNRPDLTAESFDGEGFFATGDIGERIDEQHIRIIDRKKAFFKLANGEWVSPEAVEGVLLGEVRWLKQLCVHGTAAAARVVGVAVVAKEDLNREGATEAGEDEAVLVELRKAWREYQDRKKTVDDVRTHGMDGFLFSHAALHEYLRKKSTLAGELRHFELPRTLFVTTDAFTQQNNLLTATGKPCRHEMRRCYKKEFSEMLEHTEREEDIAEGSVLRRIKQLALGLGSEGDGGSEEEWRSLIAKEAGMMTSTFAVRVASVLSELGGGDPNANTSRTAFPVAVLLQDAPVSLARVRAFFRGDVSAAELQTGGDGEIDWDAEAEVDAQAIRAEVKKLLVEYESRAWAENADTASKTIFLTGATGHVGAAVLEELCRQTDTSISISCLVRGESDEDARTRLSKALAQRGYEAAAMAVSEGSVRTLHGDLSLPMLGLPPSRFAELALSSGQLTIFHCGAAVDHLSGYATLKKANVGSLRMLLTLWSMSDIRRPKDAERPKFLFVSTRSARKDGGGYGQSKWVAERLLRNYFAGVEDALYSVFPLGMIGLDARTGAANASDWIMRYVAGVIQLGVYYCKAGASIRLAPVDRVGKWLAAQAIGTPVSDAEASLSDLECVLDCETLMQRVVQCPGLPRAVVPTGKLVWDEELESLLESNPMFPLRHRYREGLGATAMQAEGEAASGSARFCYSQEVVERSIIFLQRQGLVAERRANALLERTCSL